ncbi:MAG: GNAT family N-acetyltransferase [Chloroflexi bacterium]|nr:GNAT family N-acetyltransferase [Chloroflexota bacterium]
MRTWLSRRTAIGAIVLKEEDALIGSVGFVPLFNAFEQIPELRCGREGRGGYGTEFGLFWAIDCLHQNLGYASEAARAMIDYAFGQLNLRRILACTEYDILASQGVMRNLGMALLRNPHTEPPWLQVVGLLENGNPTTQ